MDKEEIGKKIDEVLQLEKWRSFVNGKVTGGLAVLEVLGIEKEKRIEVLAKGSWVMHGNSNRICQWFL